MENGRRGSTQKSINRREKIPSICTILIALSVGVRLCWAGNSTQINRFSGELRTHTVTVNTNGGRHVTTTSNKLSSIRFLCLWFGNQFDKSSRKQANSQHAFLWWNNTNDYDGNGSSIRMETVKFQTNTHRKFSVNLHFFPDYLSPFSCSHLLLARRSTSH